MSVEQENRRIDQVRIPADLNARLSSFFSDLQLRILEKAVRQASARTSTDEGCVLRTEDLIATAHEALSEAATELSKALSPSELQHVRRAS